MRFRDRLFRVVQLLSALDGVDERTCAELAEGNLRDLRDALAAVQHVSGTADRTVATVSSAVTALFGSPGSGLAVAVGRVPTAQPNSPMAAAESILGHGRARGRLHPAHREV